MSTRDRSTLVERMELARQRTIAARGAPGAAPHGRHARPAPPGPAAAPGPHGGHGHHGGGPSHGHGHGHSLGHPGGPTRAAASHGAATPPTLGQVAAQSGEHLVLMPGQLHFGPLPASLRTLLGSCVAVTLWHPQRRIGGMCHYLLPSRTRSAGEPADGRYGDEALQALVNLLRQTGTDPAEYQAHLYGGADTMPDGANLKFNVGERNIEQGWSLIDRYGFQLQGVDVGEDVPRTVTLTLANGEVEMRRGSGRAPPLVLDAGATPARIRHG